MASRKTPTRREPQPERHGPKPPAAATSRKPKRSMPSHSGSSSPATAGAPAPPAGDLQVPGLAPEIEAELRHSAAGPAGPARRLGPREVAGVLQEIAALLQLTDANTFKVRAYENAARSVAGLEDLHQLLDEDRLQEVPGIGESIAEKIATLVRTGRMPYHEELRAQLPAGLLEMMRIPGLGPKKAKALYDGLGIESIEALEAACRGDELADLKGFGAKTAQNILLGIEQLRRVRGLFAGSFAAAVVAPVVEALRAHPVVTRAEVAGSLRRRKETVHDIDIVAGTRDAAAVMAMFAAGPWAARVLGSGETKTSVVHPSGLQMDLRAVSDTQFPYALHHFTGSKEHNIAMRGRAIRMGLKMNEYGLFRGETLVPCSDEAAIFAALGLDFVPPELREDQGEIEAAEAQALPSRLLSPDDLRGVLHVHTGAAGGRSSLEALVRAAAARGWEYVGISDHGPGAPHTRGLDAAGFERQRRDLDKLATKHDIRILHGVECEIGADGSLDLDASVLQQFDFVIAGAHAGFDLDREAQTRRLVGAIENPCTTILAHPTGRILLQRDACDADWPAVFEAAARHGVALEIDAHPQRMDLDGLLAKQAREHDALLCIGPDAHDAEGLGNVAHGIGSARRAWLEPQGVLNAWPLADLEAHLRTRRSRSA